MPDLTSTFDALLKAHEATPTRRSYSLSELDGFLKEAYRINEHITSLSTELRDVRNAYLSTAPTAVSKRKAQLHTHSQDGRQQQKSYLTDREREEVDANAKQMIRELNASISTLAEAEKLRHQTELALIQKKHTRRLGAIGNWAAAGALSGSGKSKEHAAAEDSALQTNTHRDGVLYFLRQRLQQCVKTQQATMEMRQKRELDKENATLAGSQPLLLNTQADRDLNFAVGGSGSGGGRGGRAGKAPQLPVHLEETERRRPMAGDLTAEQMQMFEKGNQDMLKHYDSTLVKVNAMEKSIIEISELQSVLVGNLATQAENIERLVSNSFDTEGDVAKANQELKKATKRPSTARYTFLASVWLCFFLIVWDLLI